MRGQCTGIWIALAALACESVGTSVTLENLPERFEPVGRLEDSLLVNDGWLCERPVKLSRDCSVDLTTHFEGRLFFPGVSLASAASADGRAVAFRVLGLDRAGRGVTATQVSNFAYATIERILRGVGVSILRPHAITSPGKLYGYLLELDGDGYAALLAASAKAPLPAPPADPTAAPTRPPRNPLSFDVALRVEAPSSVIDEARSVDAITWLNCENVVVFARDCSNWTGPQRVVALDGATATLAANRVGDVLLVGGESGFAAKLAGDSPALNRSARAVLDALRSRGIGIRRVRAAVFDAGGPAYAYVVELDRDGFTDLAEQAAQTPK